METVKTYIRQDNTATIICPACNRAKTVSIKGCSGNRHCVKARCSCGEVFMVHLDFRRHYRKQVDLVGTYMTTDPPGMGSGTVRITNISFEGLGFEVPGSHRLRPGQKLEIEFHLDDKKRTFLKKEAVVRLVEGGYIGCQFINQQHIEKALGFYLRP
ncbi:MAG TPA: PilZ domain-containing protein [Desulfobulbus sp.]|nr:PilZ domain-containing protein [Desulfobulbus sp.]